MADVTSLEPNSDALEAATSPYLSSGNATVASASLLSHASQSAKECAAFILTESRLWIQCLRREEHYLPSSAELIWIFFLIIIFNICMVPRKTDKDIISGQA